MTVVAPAVNACIERRARLAARMEPGAVAVLATAPETLRNGDSDYPYRHDSYFYYLSGFAEPESVLVLVAPLGEQPARSILFCREKNPEREIWDGYRYGPEAARLAFGFDEAYPIGELDAQMAKILANVPALYYALGHSAALDAQVSGWLKAVRAQGRSGIAAPASAHHLPAILDEMRLLKDAGEQSLMGRAASIAAGAHARAMRFTRPGVFEYEIEAELLHEFRRNGAQFPAYTPIVAAGSNACVLHYNQNNRQCREGELVLVDAGCELDGYASDITRTWPVNGRFSAPQKALYELVLQAQEAAFAAIVPGRPYSGMHEAAVRVLAAGMLDLGLIDRNKYGSPEDAIADKAHLQFYMHGTGHWLGMDVHDVGPYRDMTQLDRPSRPLLAGMALTVEPGIYVRPAEGVPEEYWNIGIRIEDDVIVTADGCRVLSGDAPKGVAEIEQLMEKR
ncbi:aminopeptidase P N-terminal domain-containing protein [Massilia sp. IC2-477]|uniref:aminopeptidase P N-terminal domain-containing protein n=1 Tax=Massilia sp. IC2-477 TaxID=2887198 RepID=UPI001D0FED5F|nr:aminopeptidase P N-terminal domain-containing protein [Massilia sp. IC2-477]MCC2957985.1 aminopeptidase P N-terminal domain-containing protein [Massilia sp. IC2-477]